MANTAPYEVNVSGSDDETFEFTLPFEQTDGTPFPFEDYAIEYVVAGRGSGGLSLTEGAGILIDAPFVSFRAEMGRLRPGTYAHGCRIKSLVSGDYRQVFDGTVTITEGNFR